LGDLGQQPGRPVRQVAFAQVQGVGGGGGSRGQEQGQGGAAKP
jgi:hypothetical protein